LDSLAVDNNEICTPSALPTCIKNNTTILFYDSQDCQITPDEEDWDFIDELITKNWGQDSLSIYREQFYNLTKWETFEETIDNQEVLRSRITEIRYNGREIKEIPDGIAELEMLTRLEFQNNQIVIIPDFIGSLLNMIIILV
jgi:Leucine-rich repeat (LRR) protein